MSNPEQLALERGICAEVGPYSISHFVPPRNYSRSVGYSEVDEKRRCGRRKLRFRKNCRGLQMYPNALPFPL